MLPHSFVQISTFLALIWGDVGSFSKKRGIIVIKKKVGDGGGCWFGVGFAVQCNEYSVFVVVADVKKKFCT